MNINKINRLPSYWINSEGASRNVSSKTREALEKSLAHDLSGLVATAARSRGRLFSTSQTTFVLKADWSTGQNILPELSIEIRLEKTDNKNISRYLVGWLIEEESGFEHSGTYELDFSGSGSYRTDYLRLKLPDNIPIGYHKLLLTPGPESEDAQSLELSLIIVPSYCFRPSHIDADTRIWGPKVDLSTSASKKSWGCGDLGDLKRIIQWCAARGGGIVALSSLGLQKYSGRLDIDNPSHRAYIDPLYIDVEAVDDFRHSEEARMLVATEGFSASLARVRDALVVDVDAVRELKFEALELAYKYFRIHHLKKETDRASYFRAFQKERGQSLRDMAIFSCLEESITLRNKDIIDWHQWPERFAKAKKHALKDFITSNIERVEFFEYLQWEAWKQLKKAGDACLDARFPVGLCLECGPWFNSSGAEAWQNQNCLLPDFLQAEAAGDYSPEGRIWHSNPLAPQALDKAGFSILKDLLRANMAFAGALRMINLGQWLYSACVPSNENLESIGFIEHNQEAILGIIALESHRNQCMVIGDLDLLSMPHASKENTSWEAIENRFLKNLKEWGILSHHDFLHRQIEKAPASSPEALLPRETAVLELAPPDLSPLSSFWQGEDINIKEEHGIFEKRHSRDELIDRRVKHRVGLLRQLEKNALLPDSITTDPASVRILTTAVSAAIIKLLALTPASIVLFRLLDLGDNIFPVTIQEDQTYDKWCYKVSPSLEELLESEKAQEILNGLQESRGFFFDDNPLTDPEPLGSDPASTTWIPTSTYRLQITREFNLVSAAKLVDYLDRLGTSHVYLSPILEARPGSPHRYDIVNHKRIDPELGGEDGLEALTAALKSKAMGLILDIVPNHMGIGKNNPWWMDVLENGPASHYSDYFDIDWHPVKGELQGKVLIPILGAPYGRVLRNGELAISFESETGKLSLHYYEHKLPLNPNSYPLVLDRRLDVLESRLGSEDMHYLSYLSIVNALLRLPAGSALSESERDWRGREFKVSISRLKELCLNSPTVAEFIEQNIKDFHCRPDDLASVQTMHELLEKQCFRLAFWRVASHEINYRRFFDINELAGVRVEYRKVFNEMHELVLSLIKAGKVQGLRIDHPDGLLDPKEYFCRLQEESDSRAVRNFEIATEKSIHRGQSQEKLPLYVVAEKILTPFEKTEPDWMIHGTTGYDFMTRVNGLLVDHRSAGEFDEFYRWCTNQTKSYEEMSYECKKLIMQTALSSELNVLAHKLNRISESAWVYRDYTLFALRSALSEVIACFPVYRTYITENHVSSIARSYINRAVEDAKRLNHMVHPDIFDFIRDVLSLDLVAGKKPEQFEPFEKAIAEFAMSFQQLTGPVMAKSLEDTLFYKYNRFVALNEVGGEPEIFGLSVQDFHRHNQDRQRHYPFSMLSTSTHDTKRSEDLRARLSVLSEIPVSWKERVLRWMEYNRGKCTYESLRIPSLNDEYLIYQTLLGVYPLPGSAPEEFDTIESRLSEYMIKAVREAKVNSSWINQNNVYESGIRSFIEEILSSSGSTVDTNEIGAAKESSAPAGNRDMLEVKPESLFLQDFLDFHDYVSRLGLLKSLSQTTLKFTCPGVPDLYQGCETWNFSLVDPDNRRPVDFSILEKSLVSLDSILNPEVEISNEENSINKLLSSWQNGDTKLYLTACCMRLRQEQPLLFSRGRYIPVGINGSAEDDFISFIRHHANKVLLVICPVRVIRAFAPDKESFYSRANIDSLWKKTRISLPRFLQNANLTNILTGKSFAVKDRQPDLDTLLKDFPVGIFISDIDPRQ